MKEAILVITLIAALILNLIYVLKIFELEKEFNLIDEFNESLKEENHFLKQQNMKLLEIDDKSYQESDVFSLFDIDEEE